jgi:putative flippase GtrA
MRLVVQLLRFSLIGTAGFVVDVAVLYLLTHSGIDLYSARACSFVAAASFTWFGNRRLTFRSAAGSHRRLTGEWFLYLGAMTLGGLVNYGTYALLITYLPMFHDHPWLAVAAGTGAGLLINFTLARNVLYRSPATSGF